MKTNKEQNERMLNLFGYEIDINILCGSVIVIVLIYPIIMCVISCCASKEKLWENAANFGNMYGALGCLFSGLASVAMIATLVKQSESNKYQKDELDCAKSKNDKEVILKMISMMVNARDSLQYEKQLTGQAVSEKLRENLKDSLYLFIDSMQNINLREKKKQEAIDKYKEIIDTYLPISAIFFHIVDFAITSNNMNEDERKKIIMLALHCLSKADNQLMRVVLSHKDYSHTFNELEYTKKEFGNERITCILSNLLNNGMSDDKKKVICKSYLSAMHLSE